MKSNFIAIFESLKQLDEGMFVVKNLDGVEKRFKDDTSPEAKAWAKTKSEKTKSSIKFSDAWWEEQDLDVTPKTQIVDASDEIDSIVKDHFGGKHITTDWTLGSKGTIEVEGTTCATRVIRVMYEHKPESDLGHDEPVSDSQNIVVRRDRKNPNKIVFVKYS